ncbi:sensory neuron membrane protein 1-like [Sitodiplosis mosellana]|uniref:sensory neuron membrane protein 1-like n=1 Tax=Sitodiplosis mosellana TaxID=263140 RepID=UPI002443E71F|nr:sensory neuron membrane protein 1-like [Sitodiplosis mosellana]
MLLDDKRMITAKRIDRNCTFVPVFTFIEKNVNLRKNCIERGIYETLPFPLTLKFYIFDILNKDEVHNGSKPILKEIGPFYFDEYIWKNNISDNDAEDTMAFNIMKKYIFRPDLSKNLTGDEIVTTMHPVIAAIGLTVHFEFRQFLHVASTAIKEIFHSPTDAFWTGKAMDLLYNGIGIDCSTKNPLAKLACNEIRKSKNPMIQKMNRTQMKFSILGGVNFTSTGHWKVNRGVKNIRKAGQVIEVDGQTELKVWGEGSNQCNQLVGTDGLLFTPLQSKKKPLTFFVQQICTSLHLKYEQTASYRGVDLHTFTKEFEDFSANNLTRCFCRQPDRCPIQGTMDLLPCVQVPVTISLPHFYRADPSLLANIASGLKPTKKKHEFFISLELNSGVALRGAGRVQINFEVEPIKEIEIMANLPKMIFPWIWFEESAEVPDSLVNLLKYTLTLAKTINCALQWITLTYWLFGTIICTTLFVLSRYANVNIFEEGQSVFMKSPNLSKIGAITTASELSDKVNDGLKTIDEKDADVNVNGEDTNSHSKNGAVILLNEIVTKAASAANKSRLQTDFNSIKF